MTTPSRASLRIRIVPRAARSTIARDAQGALRIHLSAPPVEGAANRALLALLAERLGVPKRALELARGARSRIKVVYVHGMEPAELERRLTRALGFRR